MFDNIEDGLSVEDMMELESELSDAYQEISDWAYLCSNPKDAETIRAMAEDFRKYYQDKIDDLWLDVN